MSDPSILFSTKRTARPGQTAHFDKIITAAADLSNARIAILFYMLDMDSLALHKYYGQDKLMSCRSILFQIWKNIRTIVRNNPACRKALNLNTRADGVYTVDYAFDLVDRMYIYCRNSKEGFSDQKVWIMTQQLDNIELMLRDILQYFQYFMRTEYKQLPDILQAAEGYKKQTDPLTLEQLRGVIGKRNKIDFEGLGLIDEDPLLNEEEDDLANIEEDEELSQSEDGTSSEEVK